MERMKKCRICMENVFPLRSIVNTDLQVMYELLTLTPLETADSRPTLVCYICCARLHNCYQLRISCIASEQLFIQILDNNVLVPAEKDSLCKNSFTIAHPVVHLSIRDELERSEGNDGETSDVFDLKTVEEENGQEEADENSIDPSMHYINTIDLLDIVKNELDDYITKEEDSNSNENNTDPSMQYINTNDPLDILENELDDSITRVPVHKKLRVALQRNPEDITKSKDTKFNIATDEIKQSKTYKKIVARQKIATKSDNIIPTKDKSTFSECISTSIFNDVQIKSPSINIRVDTSVSNTSRKNFYKYTHRCNTCQKYFSSKSNLISHIRTHTGEKPFRCKFCEKRFSRKDNLNCHTRTHTGVISYTCKFCETDFSKRQHLNMHIRRTHADVKPFECKICKKSFREKANLNNHNRIHTRENLIKCKLCAKCFSTKSDLHIHIRTAHRCVVQ